MSSIASAEPAWVDLCGRAEALAHLEAPLSGRRCLLYRVVLGLRHRLSAPRRRAQEIAGLSFLLRSDGRLMLTEPATAQLSLPTRLRARLRRGDDAACDARLGALFARLERELPPATVNAREQRLEAGDHVHATGWLVEERPHQLGAARGYREPPRLPVLIVMRLEAGTTEEAR